MDPATIMTIIKVASAAKEKGSKAGKELGGDSILSKYGGENPKLSFGSEKKEEPKKEDVA